MPTDYADYISDGTRAINDIFLQSFRPNQADLTRISNIACNTLNRIVAQTQVLDDLSKLAYTQERVLDEYKAICESAAAFSVQFYRVEECALIEAGIAQPVAASFLQNARGLRESIRNQKINPSQVMFELRQLREEACYIAEQLHSGPIKFGRRHRMKKRLLKISYAIGGVVMVGVDAGALAASVGLSAAGSAVSGAVGSALVGLAVATDGDMEPELSQG